MSEEKTLKISKIEDGIVIDHINPGSAMEVLSVLKITGRSGFTVSLLMNVRTGKGNSKDVVKIEKKKLRKKELDLISMVSPNATINIVENFAIKEKFNVSLPERVDDIIKCQNQNCVTNAKEPVKTVLTMEKKGDNLLYRCHYCERTMTMDEIRNSITK